MEPFNTSATLVATTIFRLSVGWNTSLCSLLDRLAWRGRMTLGPIKVVLRASIHCRISGTPGMKIRIAPGPWFFAIWETIAATSCGND